VKKKVLDEPSLGRLVDISFVCKGSGLQRRGTEFLARYFTELDEKTCRS
jgi:hypothetical protein